MRKALFGNSSISTNFLENAHLIIQRKEWKFTDVSFARAVEETTVRQYPRLREKKKADVRGKLTLTWDTDQAPSKIGSDDWLFRKMIRAGPHHKPVHHYLCLGCRNVRSESGNFAMRNHWTRNVHYHRQQSSFGVSFLQAVTEVKIRLHEQGKNPNWQENTALYPDEILTLWMQKYFCDIRIVHRE